MTTDQNDPPRPTAAERIASMPDPPSEAVERLARENRQRTIFLIVASLGMALGLIGAAVALGSRDEAQQRSDRNAEAAAQAQTQASAATEQGKAATDGLEEANRRLAELGKPTIPVPTITVTPEPPPPVAVEGLNAPQLAAVRSMIAAEAARLQPRLSQADVQQIARTAASMVPKPADGKMPTAAQLQPLAAAAVVAFCAGDRCRGEAGRPGATVTGPPGAIGRPGADSTVPGPAGKDAPPVTDEQLRPLITSQLVAYCTQESEPCRGKVGPEGKMGPQGPEGRGIRNTRCLDNGDWLFLYTDGSTDTTAGPCRAVIVPPTEPPPNPAAKKTR